MTFRTSLLATLLLSSFALAETDREESVSGINLSSSKSDATRTYHADYKRQFPVKAEYITKAILNFSERCNNAHKKMRQFTDKNQDCRYHNESYIESFFVTEFNKENLPKNDFTDWYLIGRQVYNRGHYGYYELVEVLRQDRNTTVTVKMLSDEEARKYTDIKFKHESAFNQSTITYNVVDTGKDTSELNYKYETVTDHWILNKAISVPQVFASIGKNVNELVKNIETDATRLRREIASK